MRESLMWRQWRDLNKTRANQELRKLRWDEITVVLRLDLEMAVTGWCTQIRPFPQERERGKDVLIYFFPMGTNAEMSHWKLHTISIAEEPRQANEIQPFVISQAVIDTHINREEKQELETAVDNLVGRLSIYECSFTWQSPQVSTIILSHVSANLYFLPLLTRVSINTC